MVLLEVVHPTHTYLRHGLILMGGSDFFLESKKKIKKRIEHMHVFRRWSFTNLANYSGQQRSRTDSTSDQTTLKRRPGGDLRLSTGQETLEIVKAAEVSQTKNWDSTRQYKSSQVKSRSFAAKMGTNSRYDLKHPTSIYGIARSRLNEPPRIMFDSTWWVPVPLQSRDQLGAFPFKPCPV